MGGFQYQRTGCWGQCKLRGSPSNEHDWRVETLPRGGHERCAVKVNMWLAWLAPSLVIFSTTPATCTAPTLSLWSSVLQDFTCCSGSKVFLMLMIRQSHTSRLLLAGQRKPRVGSSAWEQMMHCKMEPFRNWDVVNCGYCGYVMLCDVTDVMWCYVMLCCVRLSKKFCGVLSGHMGMSSYVPSLWPDDKGDAIKCDKMRSSKWWFFSMWQEMWDVSRGTVSVLASSYQIPVS